MRIKSVLISLVIFIIVVRFIGIDSSFKIYFLLGVLCLIALANWLILNKNNKKIAVLVISIFIFLLLAESAARLIDGIEYKKSYYKPIALDSIYNPSDNILLSYEKIINLTPESKPYILALGDSVTEAISHNEFRFANLIESNLNITVLNTGTSGYGSIQEAVFLEKLMVDKPDIIVFSYVYNDPIADYGIPINQFLSPKELRNRRSAISSISNLPFSCKLRNVFLASSFLERIYFNDVFIERAINPFNTPELQNLESNPKFVIRAHKDICSWKTVEYSFERIAELAGDTPVVLVVFPWLHSLKNYEYVDIQNKVLDLGRENGFIVVDALESYKNHDDSEIFFASNDRIHPSFSGHQIVYEQLEPILKPLVHDIKTKYEQKSK